MHFPYLGGMVEAAEFTRYPDTGDCVEVLMRIGLIKGPYTFVLSIAQALDADIIERVEEDERGCRCPVRGGRTDDPEGIHGRGPKACSTFDRKGRRINVTIPE
jgi:hypothetical protein